jgi:hypothetical protein
MSAARGAMRGKKRLKTWSFLGIILENMSQRTA